MQAQHRLRHNDDFRLTTRKGVRAARSHVVVHLAILNAPGAKRVQEAPRVGFVVSKKVGNSVVRSRTKRRLRALMRARITHLPPYATVVIRTLPGINEQSSDDLAASVDGALAAALRRLEEKARP